jgi:uncharacterized protein (DUF362 family)/NAD-dependent dihydropyrimidine dehydrogenase PreA subunit
VDRVITRACDYGKAEKAVRELAKSSGLQGRVLVKPNLLAPVPPEEATTTHPMVVRGAVEGLLDAGCEVLLGDSSASQDTLARLLKATGIGPAVADLDVELVEVDRLPAAKLVLNGYSKEKWIPVCSALEDVDGILNLPKFKTHMLTGFTGATKNYFGLVPRKAKKEFHARLTNPAQFSAMIVDLAHSLSKGVPCFSIMDAVRGMEGEGPHGGPVVDIGLLVAGDHFQVDDAVLGMVKPEFRVFTQEIARSHGLVGSYEIKGPVKEFALKRPKTYRAARVAARLPNIPGMSSLLGVGTPEVTDRCTGCRTCVENCPVDAISMRGGRAHIDRSKCIKCFTCTEVCPVDAIEVRRRLL